MNIATVFPYSTVDHFIIHFKQITAKYMHFHGKTKPDTKYYLLNFLIFFFEL